MARKFVSGIVVILVVYVIGSWGLINLLHFSAAQVLSLKISGILATLNVLLAFFVIYFTRKSRQEIFVRFFLATMVVRLLLMLAVVFMVLQLSTADHFIFISSLFVLYFVYQTWELLVLNSYFKKG